MSGEADVEMAFEERQARGARWGLGVSGGEKRAAESVLRGCGAGGERRKFQEIASLHGCLRASLCD